LFQHGDGFPGMTHVEFTGNEIIVRELPGHFENSESQNSNKIVYRQTVGLTDEPIVIRSQGRFRVRGQINANVVLVGTDIWIEDHVTTNHTVTLVAMGNIVLRDPPQGNSRTLNVAANLLTTGSIRNQSNKQNHLNLTNGAISKTNLSSTGIDDAIKALYPGHELELEADFSKILNWSETVVQIVR